MKLKLVVVSMSVLGLISSPAFANHHRHHHHAEVVAAAPEARADYKAMGALCTVNPSNVVLNDLNQNAGRAMHDPCRPDWFNRIGIAGGVNLDMGKWGNRNAGYTGENYKRVSLNDAYLNVSADITDWAKAFASISYNTTTFSYSAATLFPANRLNLEQGFVTIANFDQSPFYARLGKGFQHFSSYQIHPITRSLTESLSETLATAVEVGFVTQIGFNGSLSVFDTPINRVGSTTTATDYVASLGFAQPNDQLGWDLGVAYQYNMIGVNDIARAAGATFVSRAAGVAVYADVNSGPFNLGARYTTAVQRFSPLDLLSAPASGKGAKPWAAGVQAGYGFTGWDKNQNLYVGYQTSRQASAVNLPRQRWLLGYNIDWMSNVNFGGEWDHDMAYNAANNAGTATTKTGNLVSLRAAVKFG